MRFTLQRSARLYRSFALQCLFVHPVVGTRATNIVDIKEAEEGVGLIKALDYGVVSVSSSQAVYSADKSRVD